MQAFQQKQFADADRLLRPLLGDNPRMPYAWNVEAKALVALDRLPEALDAAKTALRLAPSASDIALEVAEIALQLGHYDEARQHAELAMHVPRAARNCSPGSRWRKGICPPRWQKRRRRPRSRAIAASRS